MTCILYGNYIWVRVNKEEARSITHLWPFSGLPDEPIYFFLNRESGVLIKTRNMPEADPDLVTILHTMVKRYAFLELDAELNP